MRPLTEEERQQKLEEKRIKRIETIKEHFSSLTTFESIDDIPEIPIVPDDVYNEYIIPNLIRCGAIPKSKLKNDYEYLGACRNSEKATWKGDHFEYQRYKIGSYFTDHINHFEDDDECDVFVPIKILEKHEQAN